MNNGFLSVQTDDLDLDTPEIDTDEATQNQDPDAPKDNEVDIQTRQNWKKRYSDQQRYVTQLKQQNAALEQELTTLKEKPLELPSTMEELASFKKSHPELVNSLISLIRLEVSERDKELTEKIKKLDGKSAQADTEVKIAEVLKIHPDAKRIKASQEFADWFELQSQATQNLLKSDNPSDWIRGISLYKEDMGIKSVKVKKADAATAVNQPSSTDTKPDLSKRVWKASEVAKLSDAEYDKLSHEIMKANAEGRYINDISQ